MKRKLMIVVAVAIFLLVTEALAANPETGAVAVNSVIPGDTRTDSEFIPEPSRLGSKKIVQNIREGIFARALLWKAGVQGSEELELLDGTQKVNYDNDLGIGSGLDASAELGWHFGNGFSLSLCYDRLNYSGGKTLQQPYTNAFPAGTALSVGGQLDIWGLDASYGGEIIDVTIGGRLFNGGVTLSGGGVTRDNATAWCGGPGNKAVPVVGLSLNLPVPGTEKYFWLSGAAVYSTPLFGNYYDATVGGKLQIPGNMELEAGYRFLGWGADGSGKLTGERVNYANRGGISFGGAYLTLGYNY